MKIPFNDIAQDDLPLREQMERALSEVVASGQFVGGPLVAELERQISERLGSHAVACASGTDALLLALMAAGVGPADEVIVPAFSFISTAEAVRLVGAVPRFADLSFDDFGIASIAVLSLLSEKTAAIIPAGLYGDAGSVQRLVDTLSTVPDAPLVIEDAAQSLGAMVGSRSSGNLTPFAATSFYPTKPLGCYGEGGMVFAQSSDSADRLRRLRNHGSSGAGESFETGMNSRFDAMQAAVLLIKWKRFDQQLLRREEIADRYSALLAPLEKAGLLLLPKVTAGSRSSWAQYTIRIPRSACGGGGRDQLRSALQRRGIATAVYYSSPLHLHPVFAPFSEGRGSCPVAEQLADEVLSLPIFLSLQTEQQERVATIIAEELTRSR